jgi:multidrug resistance efflux pump
LQWLIDEGTAVEPGDAIARFDPGATQANLHNSQDQLEEKRQERESRIAQDAIRRMELELALRKAEVAYKKAQIDAAVTQDLLRGKDYRQRQQLLRETEQGFRNAQLDALDHETSSNSKISEMDIELLELGKDIEDLEEELESLTLRASRSGIVLHEMHRWYGRSVRVGDRMQATMPIASIPEVHSLEVEAWAGETDAARLEAGMPVRILLDADPSRDFDGGVDFIGTAGERRESWGRGSYRKVSIRVDRVDPEIMKPGMSVRCEVDLGAATDPSLVASRGDAP